MKIKLVILSILLAIFCNVSHAKLLRWSDGAIVEGEAEEPTRTVTRTPDGLIVTYEFGEYGIGYFETGDTVSTIEMPGFIPCSTDGEPAYLFKKERFNIPNAAACSVEILEEEYKDFNITLAPAQPLQLVTDPEPPQASPITAYSGLKPQYLILDNEGLDYKGMGVFELEFSPTLYSMETKSLRLYKKLTFKISSMARGYSLQTEDYTDIPVDFDINQPLIPPIDTKVPVNTTSTLLIISTPEYEANLQEFIEWKRLLGFPVKAFYSDSWTTTTIKDVIKEAYNTDPSIGYLLIVGNQEQVPGFYFAYTENPYTHKYDVYSYSDHEYTLITQNRISEVARGRMSVNTPQELKNLINKIITYENNPTRDKTFYQKGSLLSYIDTNGLDTEKPSSANRDTDWSCFIPVCEEIFTYLSPLKSTSTSRIINRLYSYRKPRGYFKEITKWGNYYNNGETISPNLSYDKPFWNHGNRDFINDINDGCAFGLYLGHGNWDCFYNDSWYGQGQLDFDKVDLLNNKDKYPFLIVYSCLTANYARDNIAARFMSKKDAGCIGYFGATNSIRIIAALRASIKTVHTLWNESEFSTKVSSSCRPANLSHNDNLIPLRAGNILNSVVEDIGLNYTVDQKGMHYLGDPTMYLRINSPMEFDKVSATYADGKLKVDVPKGSCNIAFYETTLKEPKSECWYGSSATYETQNPEAVTITLYGPDLVPYIFKYGGKRLAGIESKDTEPDIEMNCTNEAGQIISVSFDGNNVPTTLIITNLTTQAQTVTNVEADCSLKEISVNASGAYSVSLVSQDNIIQTQKIIVNQ